MMTEQEFRTLASSLDRSGQWPAGDERGALNLITPRTVAAAAATVTTGTIVSCADRLPAGPGSPSDPRLAITTSTDAAGNWMAINETVTFDQHGPSSMTHYDALGHFFYDGVSFAGATPGILTPHGVRSHDILAASAGIVSRGLLVDLPRIAGVPYLKPGHLVDRASVCRWLAGTGTTPWPGDVLFVRTGRPVAPPLGPGEFPQVGGLDLDCAPWVHREEFALIVSDCGLDGAASAVDNVLTPWHILTLTRMGISLVDLADLEELSRMCQHEGRQTFLAILAPTPMRGSTASPINPIAVF